jgi:anti-anti-sigma regulatory factor
MDRHVVQAPTTLGRETHELFRRQALEALEASHPEGRGTALVIDLSATRQVDTAGLGALMLVQRRAAELRRPVYLRDASEELRLLLVMTRLDDRFVFEDSAAVQARP